MYFIFILLCVLPLAKNIDSSNDRFFLHSQLLTHESGMIYQPTWRLLSRCLPSIIDWKPISFWSHFPDISWILTNLPGHYLNHSSELSGRLYYSIHFKISSLASLSHSLTQSPWSLQRLASWPHIRIPGCAAAAWGSACSTYNFLAMGLSLTHWIYEVTWCVCVCVCWAQADDTDGSGTKQWKDLLHSRLAEYGWQEIRPS